MKRTDKKTEKKETERKTTPLLCTIVVGMSLHAIKFVAVGFAARTAEAKWLHILAIASIRRVSSFAVPNQVYNFSISKLY